MSFPCLSGALKKVCCRHFTNEAQTRQFSCPESHSQSEVGPELKFGSAWLPSHYRLSSLPVAAKGSHRARAGRMPQPLQPSRRAGTTWICFVVKTLSTWMEERGTGRWSGASWGSPPSPPLCWSLLGEGPPVLAPEVGPHPYCTLRTFLHHCYPRSLLWSLIGGSSPGRNLGSLCSTSLPCLAGEVRPREGRRLAQRVLAEPGWTCFS